MSKTSMPISHFSGEGFYVNTTIQATAASKESWLSRHNPFRSERRSLSAQVHGMVDQYCEYWDYHKSIGSVLIEQTENKWAARTLWENGPRGRFEEVAKAHEMINRMETRTLELLVQTMEPQRGYSEILSVLSNYRKEAETLLREALSYAVGMEGLTVHDRIRAFNDVRSSHSSFHYEDLSELKGRDHDRAHAAVMVAVALLKQGGHYGRDTGKQRSGSFRKNLTTPVSEVIIAQPERVQDITDYLTSGGSPDDAGRLVEYLAAPARSLAVGAL